MVNLNQIDTKTLHLEIVPDNTPLKFHVPAFAIIYGLTLLVLAVTLWAHFQDNIPFSFFSRDPIVTLNGHPLTGIQSTLGVLVWCVAAGICFFSGLVLQRALGDRNLGSFLLCSGVISTVLALDDMFLFHEDLAFRYLGVSEKLVYLVYASLVFAWLIRFHKNILNTRYGLLFLAFVFFALSIAVDLLLAKWSSDWRIFLEDGFKLLGIVTWSSYLMRTCLNAMIAHGNPDPDGRCETLRQS